MIPRGVAAALWIKMLSPVKISGMKFVKIPLMKVI